MSAYLHTLDAGSPELLAAELGLPVILADEPLHRRVAVHYLYFPNGDHVRVHRSFSHALHHLVAHSFSEVAIIHAADIQRATFYRLQLRPSPGVNQHG